MGLRKHSKAKETKKFDKRSADDLGIPNNSTSYVKSMHNDETVEYVHCNLKDAHVFQLPIASKPETGWSAMSMAKESWQGTIKVVNRDGFSGLLLLDRLSGAVFAVCPLADMERCTDSSRYFVVQVKDATKTAYMGVAFNERTAAFDFNVAIGSCKRERDSKELPPPDTEASEPLLKRDAAKTDWLLNSEDACIGDRSGSVEPEMKDAETPMKGRSSGMDLGTRKLSKLTPAHEILQEAPFCTL